MTIDARLNYTHKTKNITFTASYNKIEGKKINQIHTRHLTKHQLSHPTQRLSKSDTKRKDIGHLHTPLHLSGYHLHLCKLKAQIIKMKSTNNLYIYILIKASNKVLQSKTYN